MDNNENEPSNKIADAIKDATSFAVKFTAEKAKQAAGAATDKAGEIAHDTSEAAKKATIEKLGGEYRGSEDPAGRSETSKPGEKPKKKKLKKWSIAIVIVVIAALVFFGIAMPAATSKITKENTVTSSILKKAVDIDDLSTAQFVYNGIAEKYKDNGKDVAYRISYDSVVKAGIRMSDVQFDIDDKEKTVTVTLPDIIITSVSVDVNTLSYMPENPSGSDIKMDLATCENDVKRESEESEKFYSYAQENLKAVIEGLVNPLIQDRGYSIDWAEMQ